MMERIDERANTNYMAPMSRLKSPFQTNPTGAGQGTVRIYDLPK